MDFFHGTLYKEKQIFNIEMLNDRKLKYSERNPVYRYWVFTCNNYTDSNVDFIKNELSEIADFDYVIVGYEVGEKGTHHLQGYAQFRKGIRFKRLRQLLDRRDFGGAYCSIERARGSAVQNRGYCWKGEAEKMSWPTWETEAHPSALYFERGNCQFNDNQGGRTDLVLIKDLLKNNDIKAVKEEFFPQWVRYHKSFEKYLAEQDQTHVRSYKKRKFKSSVYVNTGPPGSGKTKYFWDKYDNMDTITYANGFIIGYTGAPVVLFDDFESERVPRGLFLQLIDRYPMKVNVKGGSMEWNPETICITSNYDPESWYGYDLAVLRRIDEINKFNS